MNEYLKKNLRIIEPNFFSVNAIDLAKKILGKIIVRKVDDKIIKAIIVETEAYMGINDKACHSHEKNRLRKKCLSLYKEGGFSYVFMTYGKYFCFNIVSSIENDPQGVLIRAIEPLNSLQKNFKETNGPGKLCNFLKIDLKFDGINLINSNELYLEENEDKKEEEIVFSKRINIENSEEDKHNL